MNSNKKTEITINTLVKAPVNVVWKCWSTPEDILKWNHASDDWHTTRAENDLKVGGKFLSRMEAKDGSFGFDFGGIYESVIPNQLIEYEIGDGRKVKVEFKENGNNTEIIEIFEAEQQNSIEMQREGWQAILNNFKKYVESRK